MKMFINWIHYISTTKCNAPNLHEYTTLLLSLVGTYSLSTNYHERWSIESLYLQLSEAAKKPISPVIGVQNIGHIWY